MAVISTRRSIRVKPARFKKVVEAVAAASETCQLTTVALLEIEYGEVNPDKADCILPSYSFCMAVHEPLLLQERSSSSSLATRMVCWMKMPVITCGHSFA